MRCLYMMWWGRGLWCLHQTRYQILYDVRPLLTLCSTCDRYPTWIATARKMTAITAGTKRYSTSCIWTWSGNTMVIGFQTTNDIRRDGLISWTGTLIVTDLV